MSSGVELEKKIKKIIAKEIRPMLLEDGGNIEFLDYSNGVVTVKLLGACHGCPMRNSTLINVVENTLKEQIPDIQRVEMAETSGESEDIDELF
jgi:Fe-S cluster biogenesis protein NfuA